MPAFVTESLSEDLSVLILSQTEVLAEPFAKCLEQQGLTVTLKSSDLGSLKALSNGEYSPTWYKIYWIDDVSSVSEEKAREIVKIFKENKGLTYVVTHQPFSYRGEKYFEAIGRKLSDIYTFFLQRSPYTTFLTYKDVLTDEVFSLLYQEKIQFLSKKKFAFSTDTLTFVELEEVINHLAGLSFDPRGGKKKVVVHSKPTTPRTLLRALQAEFKKRKQEGVIEAQYDYQAHFQQDFSDSTVKSSLEIHDVVNEIVVHAKSVKLDRVEKWESSTPASNLPKPKNTTTVSTKKTVEPLPQITPIPESELQLNTSQEKTVEKSIPPAKETMNKTVVTPVLNNIPRIQERSIQVHVLDIPQVPLLPSNISIPPQTPPEFKRSKVVLQQLSDQFNSKNDHRHPRNELNNAQLSRRVVERVHATAQKEEIILQEQKKTYEQSQKLDLEKKISTLFAPSVRQVVTPKKKRTISPSEALFGRTIKHWSKRKTFTVFFGGTIATSVILAGLIFISSTWILERSLARGFSNLSSSESSNSSRGLKMAFRVVQFQETLYGSVLGNSVFSDISDLTGLTQTYLNILSTQEKIFDGETKAVQQLFGSEQGSVLNTLSPLLTTSQSIYKDLSLIEAELKQDERVTFLHAKLTSDELNALISTISNYRKRLLIEQQVIDILPGLVGTGSKTYAILIQDSHELRATGGFIQTVAIVSIQNGTIEKVEYLLPDEVNSALVQPITPPDEVVKHLGEDQWYLRDANWAPQFDQTAKQVEEFLEKSKDIKVQGVMTLTVDSVEQLLETVGGVSVEEYDGERVTKDNFSDRLRYYTKQSLLLSSDEKKTDFLTAVVKSLLSSFSELQPDQARSVVAVTGDLLQHAEVHIYSDDARTQNALQTLRWDGSIILPPCPAQLSQEHCTVSHIYQVDSNIGVNKVNAFVKKKVDHSIEIAEETINHQRSIQYENSSASNSWPDGAYKAYIRWFIPLDAQLGMITMNGAEIATEEVAIYREKNVQVVGAVITVLPQSTTKVVLEYSEQAIAPNASFAFFDQRQAGTGTTPTNVHIFYDEMFTPIVIAPDAQISEEKLSFSFWGGEHIFAGVKFR